MTQKKDTVREKGERWYRKLKPKLEPKLNGKVIVIAVDSGLYVFGDDDVSANKAFSHFVGRGVAGYGRKIGPDPYTAKVGA
jgi:hypothetical protein